MPALLYLRVVVFLPYAKRPDSTPSTRARWLPFAFLQQVLVGLHGL